MWLQSLKPPPKVLLPVPFRALLLPVAMWLQPLKLLPRAPHPVQSTPPPTQELTPPQSFEPPLLVPPLVPFKPTLPQVVIQQALPDLLPLAPPLVQ